MSDRPSEDLLHQPHDKLFKAGFSDPLNTAALLQAELPSQLVSLIDWAALTPLPDSFVDSHYQASHADLLFATTLSGRDCLIYLLFEHQSTEDPFMALRLLRYLVRIWETYLKEHPDASKLPVVLPVVLMQNAREWKIHTRFSVLFDLSEEEQRLLHPYLPDFCFQSLQLAQMSFEAIRGTPSGILILRVMKAYRLDQLLDATVWDEELFNAVPSWLFELVMRYILDGDIDKEAFETNLKRIKNSHTRTTAMTLAQRYHQEGVLRGRQEGRQEGQQEGILRGRQEDVVEVLEVRFNRVPEGLQEVIRGIKDEVHLRRLHRVAIQCVDLESFSSAL